MHFLHIITLQWHFKQIKNLKPVENNKKFKIHPYFVSKPACLPTIRPTSSGKIGPVFSQCRILICYHRTVDPIKIYPLQYSESLYPSLLLFLFDWWTKASDKSLKRCWWIVTTYTYYVMLMNMHMITSPVKIIN